MPWRIGAHIPLADKVIAVALPDFGSVIVGTASHLEVFDAISGAVLSTDSRPPSSWLREEHAMITVRNASYEPAHVPAYLLEAGRQELQATTADCWHYGLTATGARLWRERSDTLDIQDSSDYEIAGFSTDGCVFALLTSTGLTVAYRETWTLGQFVSS
jgi:hypothetical protein